MIIAERRENEEDDTNITVEISNEAKDDCNKAKNDNDKPFIPPTPRMTPDNDLVLNSSPSTITMDRGEEGGKPERFTGYNTRSSSGKYRTSYGREINPPERLTTGTFQFIQGAIVLAINEVAQDITINDVHDKLIHNKEEYISEVINYCNQTHEKMGKEFVRYANEHIKLATTHHEVLAVGAGIGGGFVDTSELKPMKNKEAMLTKDKEQWIKAVDDEYN